MTPIMTMTPARLRTIRSAAQLTQQQIADLISVDRSTIAKYESMERGFSKEIERRLILAIGWNDPELQAVIASIQAWKKAAAND